MVGRATAENSVAMTYESAEAMAGQIDERIESFLYDALSHGGRESVRIFLSSYRCGFPDVPLSSYRERVLEEIERKERTPEHHQLRMILEVIDEG
jgi:hypothetical protein